MGNVTYANSFVAFIDLLGFSALIDKESNGPHAEAIISQLREAMVQAKARLQSKWSWEKDALDVRMFSDCLCVAVPARVENLDVFFQLLALVQANFLRRRLVLRGAVAIGKHFADDLLVFSEGLVKAYTLESTVARFPRIIVPHEFWAYVVAHGTEEDIFWFKDTYIWHDPIDERMFIDYLNFMPFERGDDPHHGGRDLINHKTFIIESIQDHSSPSQVREKYQWMGWYHNSWCTAMYHKFADLLIPSNFLGGFA